MSSTPANGVAAVAPVSNLVHTTVLLQTPEEYLKPSPSYHAEWSRLAKQYADILASDVSASQTKRQQVLRKSRKRKHVDADDHDDEEKEEEEEQVRPLQIREVHVDGFTVRQIWEQINIVLKASRDEIQRDASLAEKRVERLKDGVEEDGLSQSDTEDSLGSVEGREEEEDEDEDEDGEFEGLSDQSGEKGDEEGNQEEMDDSAEEGTEEPEPSQLRSMEAKKASKPDPFGLNDGFFSIDDFNAQSAMFERKDAQGENGDEEDEERINWDADPNAASGMEDSEDDEDDDDDDDDDDMDNITGMRNTNDIMYADFFGPPNPLVSSNKGDGKKKGTQSRHDDVEVMKEVNKEKDEHEEEEEEEERDMERAISDVRRDLFDDDMSDEDFGDEGADGGGDTLKSTHERHQIKIMDEIRRLEAANVAKREWTLAGEAEAHDRPVNSLIEEDLDFERVGKPVPVITNEVSEDIEALIKRRIIAREFDEVIRRRPSSLTDRSSSRAQNFILEETKSQKSLGELYEADFQKQNDPNYVDPRDEKLKKEHAEIATLWKDLASQLDILTSWHHRPAPPQATISVVKDTATIEMEDVRPGVSGAITDARTLAPQEVYAPGREGGGVEKGEIVLKSGAAISKEEMTREEKHRRRRKEKRARAKQFSQEKAAATAAAAASADKGGVSRKAKEASEKKQLVSDLKKGGVKVIGKAGSLTDVTGNKVVEGKRGDEPRKLKL
ncbi:U3 snoRNP protein [Ascosphaera aggregata]|nr:U3 snoRNP protein [Ascosphaera aggregata]